jgi:hypothetical protein
LGVTLKRIDSSSENILFVSEDGRTWEMYHEGDCCETVEVEDIIGDLEDLIGSPIVLAEVVTSENENPDGVPFMEGQDYSSYTWTFYKLATVKGYVTIRRYGESNGYYSEEVNFRKL